jgi:hypothetical protein
LIVVGKTVESYRLALELEISRWNGFARALRKEDREAFEELMGSCRNNAMAAGNATNPIIFEPMVLSILLFQQKRITQLERELQAIKPEETNPSETQVQNVPVEPEPKPSAQPAAIGGGQSRLF